MLTQTGVITALSTTMVDQNTEGMTTSKQTIATIRVMPASTCERCATGQGCGAGLFARLLSSKATALSLPVAKEARVGQKVWLTVDERSLLIQAWYWYGIPIIGFLLGAAIPVWEAILPELISLQVTTELARDGVSLLSGILTMVICWLLVKMKLQPTLPRVLLNSPCTD